MLQRCFERGFYRSFTPFLAWSFGDDARGEGGGVREGRGSGEEEGVGGEGGCVGEWKGYEVVGEEDELVGGGEGGKCAGV